MNNSIKSIFIIIGTIIGAGFASGQEIYSFFNIYGENGILGLIISNIITGIVIYKVLIKVNKNNIESYKQLLEYTKTSKKFVNILNSIINIFLLMSFFIMVSGFVAYFKQEFNFNPLITTIAIILICYITFNKNLEGITNVNNVVIPILILIICTLAIKSDILETIKCINIGDITISANWIIKSIEYASYNSILLVPILISIKKYTSNKEKRISIVVVSILIILSNILFFVMYEYKEISNIEIPLIYVASRYGKIFEFIYGIVIVIAIYTTMISAGYSFLNNCSKNKKTYNVLSIIICVSAIFISKISFTELVQLTYPTFGILGIMQLIKVLK